MEDGGGRERILRRGVDRAKEDSFQQEKKTLTVYIQNAIKPQSQILSYTLSISIIIHKVMTSLYLCKKHSTGNGIMRHIITVYNKTVRYCKMTQG